MDIRLLPIYFVIGGLTVAVSAYFGSQGKGLLAAFIALFPGVTLITVIAIYFHGGPNMVVSYARGVLILLPPFLLYIAGIIYLTPRLSLTATLVISVAVYMIVSFLIIRLTDG